MRSTGSFERLKALRYGRWTRKKPDEVPVPALAQRKDSVVDVRYPSVKAHETSDREESVSPPLKAVSPNSTPRTPTPTQRTPKEIMASITRIDELCSQHAELYKTLGWRRHRLQTHMLSCLEDGEGVSSGRLQDGHRSLAVISAEMDVLVGSMLEEHVRKTTLIQSLQESFQSTLSNMELAQNTRPHTPLEKAGSEERLTMSYAGIMNFLDESNGDD